MRKRDYIVNDASRAQSLSFVYTTDADRNLRPIGVCFFGASREAIANV